MPPRQQTFEKIVLDLGQEFSGTFLSLPTDIDQSLRDRIRRALSWMKRAAAVSHEDRPPRFVELWIALNALYGRRNYGEESSGGEFEDFEDFITRLGKITSGQEMLQHITCKQHIRRRARNFVKNQYLWIEFWEGNMGELNVQIANKGEQLERAISCNDSIKILKCLFERLKVLRNQIFHGSSAANTRHNQDALVPGILLLEELLPAFVKVMISQGTRQVWPEIPYPARRTPLHPKSD